MPKPTGEVPAAETPESAMIGRPPGMTQEQLDAVAERMAPQEPVVDEAAQAVARQRIIDNQVDVEQASAEAVNAAQSANAARGVDVE